jgi:hypothetical protein
MTNPGISRPSVAARIGCALLGAVIGIAATVVISTVVAVMDGSSAAWALGLVVLVYGAPTGIVVGAIIGARWTPRRTSAIEAVPGTAFSRRLRDAPVVAWLLGIFGGTASFVCLLVVAAIVTRMASIFIGMLYPGLTRLLAVLLLLTAIWLSIRAAIRLIRCTDRRLRARHFRAA